MKKQILSVGLALSLIVSSVPLMFSATASGAESITPTGETASLIVTLDAPSLLDYVNESGGAYQNVGELLLSEQGEQYMAAISSQQEQIRQQIVGGIPSADLSDSVSYQAITNGFTVKADIAYREWIASLSGVRSALVSQEYPAVRTPEETEQSDAVESSAASGAGSSSQSAPDGDEPESEEQQFGMASKSTVNVQEAYDMGYTGKGTLIAVIDSEFDVDHQVFSVKPQGAKYNRRYVHQVHRMSHFNIAEEYEIGDLFYNGKIIYAYDYGDNDTDCRGEDFYHGTHVASIAAGDNGGNGEFRYLGMAYDAQLALMKISDRSGYLRDEAIVSALDDAVKLSPDVINCSYGAVEYLSYDYEGKQLYEKLTDSGVAVVASAGNSAYNGYDVGLREIPTEHVNYSTIVKPSSMTGVYSVASVVPNGYYSNNLYFVLNDERKIQSELYPLGLSVEDVARDVSSQNTDRKNGRELLFEDDEDYSVEDIYEYVYANAEGEDIDYSSLDLDGKIMVFDQGEEPLETIVKEAYRHGCADLIVIRNDEYYHKSFINNAEVSVFMIDSSEKEYFMTHESGMIAIRISTQVYEKTPTDARCAAEYSSFGTKADLTLKPDIAAPGSDVLGAAYDGGYMLLSGTSMAAPCTSGAVAIMKQYFRESGLSEHLSPYQTEERIYQLMMSTADLSLYPSELTDTERQVCYSPRQQGAGIINLGQAIRTAAYLSVDDARPKVSLKDSETGEYEFSFTITNRSSATMSYYPNYLIQTDGYRVNDSKRYPYSPYLNTLIPVSIRDQADVRFYRNGRTLSRVIVKPGASATLQVRIRLHDDFIARQKKIFTNGFYVDGYITMTSGSNVPLHMLFSGFCGKWDDEGIFPADYYSHVEDYPDRNSTLSIVSLMDGNNDLSLTAGMNIFGYDDLPTQIAVGKNSIRSYYRINGITYVSYSVLLPNLYLLREAMDYSISLKDQQDNLLYYQNYGGISSYYNPTGQPYTEFIRESNHYMVYNYCQCMETLPEGDYEYGIEAWTVGTDGNPGKKENRTFQIRVDNTEPVIKSARLQKTDDEKRYLTVIATDNNYLQGLSLSAVTFDENHNVESTYPIMEEMDLYFGSRDAYMTYRYDEETGNYIFRYDLTKYQKFLTALASTEDVVYVDDDITITFEKTEDYSQISRTVLALEAVDYAYNTSDMELIDVNSYGAAELTFLDSNNQPLSGVKGTIGSKTYTSNRNGIMKISNLSLGEKKLRLTDGYRLLNDETVISFSLSKDDYTFREEYQVKKVETPQEPSGESSDESSHPKIPERSRDETSRSSGNQPMKKETSTIVMPYHTGQSFPVIPFMICVTTLVTLVIVLPVRRRRR